MKEKVYRFMSGRNGPDQLTRALTVLALAVLVLNLFVRSAVLNIVWLAIMACAYYRMFSRNLARRREENGRFLQWQYKTVSAVPAPGLCVFPLSRVPCHAPGAPGQGPRARDLPQVRKRL